MPKTQSKDGRSTMTTCRFALITVALLSLLPLATSRLSAQTPVEPLLQKYCLGCHNETDREAGLSLQTFESLKKGGENGPVLVKDDLSKSLLMAVLDIESEQAMPPKGEPQPTDVERRLLRKWVLAGAAIKSMAAGRPNVPETKPFGKLKRPYLSATVSSENGHLILGGDRFIQATDADTGKLIWEAPVDGKVNELSFSSTGDRIIAAIGIPGVSGKAVVLSAKDGKVSKEFSGHTDAVYSATMNKAGTLLATAGYDRRILLHNIKTGQVVRSLEGHNGSVFSLAFDPTGTVLCSASADSTVKVWNVTTGARLDTLSQPGGEQYSVIVSDDGQRIYAAGADNRIRIWRLRSRDTVQINPQLMSRFAHEQTINRLTMSADGRFLASAAEDGSIQVWKAWPFEHHVTLAPQTTGVTALVFLGNTKLYVARPDGKSEMLAVIETKDSSKAAEPNAHGRTDVKALPKKLNELEEKEGNNAPDSAQRISLPVVVSGSIKPDGGNERDTDCFQFAAKSGQQLLMEVRAQRDKSPLDSKIEVLTTDGRPVMRTRLQAVRDSYFTFRGKDSTTTDDFRVFNWQEMELNQYLYSDGEVVKLWLYPRGPDSGYKVYPGFGKRHTYFGTTATSHALQAPCFIVVPKSPNEQLIANGLPSFPIQFENDDDPRREIGSDSRLYFSPPRDGDYVVRLTDARGFSGKNYTYKLTIRSPKPSFSVAMNTPKITVQTGTGREISFTATRVDGYEGPITINAASLPKGFAFSGPIVIEQEQLRAFGTLHAVEGAVEPSAEQLKNIKFVATTESAGIEEISGPTELKVTPDPKLRVRIGSDLAEAESSHEKSVTLKIRPGQTIRAMLQLERNGHDGVVSLGREDAGRNLPHGVFVDNIGLNGLLLLEKQTEREFFITAAKWVQPTTASFFLKTNVDGITSLPVMLEVLPSEAEEAQTVTTAAGS